MNIIKTMSDIRRLKEKGIISKSFAEHLERKVTAFSKVLEPDTSLEDFSLALHGPIGLLEQGEKDLAAIGLSASLDEIMPEWVSRMEMDGDNYYILYVLADNDYMIQVYLPDSLMDETLWAWLSEQSVEEERGEYDDDFANVPY